MTKEEPALRAYVPQPKRIKISTGKARKKLSPERVGGETFRAHIFLDSKSGGQKICYPKYKTHNIADRFPPMPKKPIFNLLFFQPLRWSSQY
ncbi:hypothetical protein [Sphingobium sp. Z007]|uniref:hypothetical protein n=1 Tax=Sphingobium sp. Z007 TaxID=627495 RepID=UPI001124D879|nr:hypothetical protein [Sphingobium sp. Z007]